MDFHVKTIDNLSTVTIPTALSSKNFMLLSMIDVYNGEAEPTYELYKVSDRVLLRGQKPTIVEAGVLCANINEIYANFKQLSTKMQSRDGMSSQSSGYMLISEVANSMGRMIRQEDVKDVVDKFVESTELSSVQSELYARGEELAQEVMDYAAALGMALITAHGTATSPTESSSPSSG